jgi:hypothetical protein
LGQQQPLSIISGERPLSARSGQSVFVSNVVSRLIRNLQVIRVRVTAEKIEENYCLIPRQLNVELVVIHASHLLKRSWEIELV